MSFAKLSPRLEACAELISGSVVCDVGTDHALLPVFLVGSGRCTCAVASDIGDKPLEAARRTILAAQLCDKISVVKSDGLDGISPDGITDVVIAGMGGELIAEIVCRCEWLKSGVRLILQPMTKTERLRCALRAAGFSVESERFVSDNGHVYTVMLVHYTGMKCLMPRMSAYTGNPCKGIAERDFALHMADNHLRIAHSLPLRHPDKEFEAALSERFERIASGDNYMKINEIYEAIDMNIPFSLTQRGDNCGLLVGGKDAEVSRALIALDITAEVIGEAVRKNAQLIISHHPVIFGGLYSVAPENPVALLLKNNIAAICTHSPLDLADGGMNDIIFGMLAKPLGLCAETEEFESVCPDGRGFGRICTAEKPLNPRALAETLKNVFGCTVVRYTASDKPVRRIAYCSGSGKSTVSLAISKGCDAYITGDLSHSCFIEARNCGLSLYDCGHFHTENIACEYLRRLLSEVCPRTEFLIAEESSDPVEYLF